MFKNMNIRNLGGTENSILVCPICAMAVAWQFRSDRLHHLGDTDLMIEGIQKLGNPFSVGLSFRIGTSELLGFGIWLKWFISV